MPVVVSNVFKVMDLLNALKTCRKATLNGDAIALGESIPDIDAHPECSTTYTSIRLIWIGGKAISAILSRQLKANARVKPRYARQLLGLSSGRKATHQ